MFLRAAVCQQVAEGLGIHRGYGHCCPLTLFGADSLALSIPAEVKEPPPTLLASTGTTAWSTFQGETITDVGFSCTQLC